MEDFFYILHCDRCSSYLNKGRNRSFFNKEIICNGCHIEEKKIRDKLCELGYEMTFEKKGYSFDVIKKIAQSFVSIR